MVADDIQDQQIENEEQTCGTCAQKVHLYGTITSITTLKVCYLQMQPTSIKQSFQGWNFS